MLTSRILKRASVQYLRQAGLLPTSGHVAASLAMWERPEHLLKIEETNRQRVADPEKLAAMRLRLAANRMRTHEQMSRSISDALFAKHGWGGFATNEALTDWIIEQHRAGTNVRQIGLAVGMSHNAVADRLRQAGFALSPRGVGQGKPAISARYLATKGYDLKTFDAEVAALYAGGASANALQNLYGVSAQIIRTSLYRSNVPVRGKGGKPSKIKRWSKPGTRWPVRDAGLL